MDNHHKISNIGILQPLKFLGLGTDVANDGEQGVNLWHRNVFVDIKLILSIFLG